MYVSPRVSHARIQNVTINFILITLFIPLAPVNPLFVLTFIPAEIEHREVCEQVQGGRHGAEQVARHVQHRQQREQEPRLQGASAVLLGTDQDGCT